MPASETAAPTDIPGTPAGTAQLYIARIGSARWMDPAADPSRNPLEDIRRRVREHMIRLRDVLDGAIPRTWDPLARPLAGRQEEGAWAEPVFRVATPIEAARIAAGADPTWHRTLSLTVGRVLAHTERVAKSNEERHAALQEAANVWHFVRSAVEREVWLTTCRLWAAGAGGYVHRQQAGGRKAWRRQLSLTLNPDALIPARIAARMASFHAAADALWQAYPAWPGSPWEPIMRIWRMGYWPAGPDREGRFVVVAVRAG